MDFDLPALLDPALSYLADALPHPLYSLLLHALSLVITLASALLNLLAPLLSTNPSEWDLQTVLPPVLTVITAYLALTSLYRTTSWMIRTTFWFLKWGIILGTLVAAASWYIGATQGHAGVSTQSNLVSQLAGFALDKMNGQNRDAASRERMNHMPLKKAAKRPKPWDTFDRHREWQYNADQLEPSESPDVDILMKNLLDAAAQMLGGSWWSALQRGGLPSSNQNAKQNTFARDKKTSQTSSS
jgi:hypothetical protein